MLVVGLQNKESKWSKRPRSYCKFVIKVNWYSSIFIGSCKKSQQKSPQLKGIGEIELTLDLISIGMGMEALKHCQKPKGHREASIKGTKLKNVIFQDRSNSKIDVPTKLYRKRRTYFKYMIQQLCWSQHFKTFFDSIC